MKKVIAVLLLFCVAAVSPVWAQSDMSQDEINRIASSVVMIGAEQGGEIAWTGSGTIVSPTGLIYTNRHVTDHDLSGYTTFNIINWLCHIFI